MMPAHPNRPACRRRIEALFESRVGTCAGRCRGFSLLELMIAIVILGLGLVMVATIFPVAWSRARKLNERTVQQAATANASATVEALVRVAGPDANAAGQINSAGFAGDMIFVPEFPGGGKFAGTLANPSVSDTRVHALNMENVRVENQGFVAEDPYEIERSLSYADLTSDLDILNYLGPDFRNRLYTERRVRFHQRVHPPVPRLTEVDGNGIFVGDEAIIGNWTDRLGRRGFCWAILHRLRQHVGPSLTEYWGLPPAERNERGAEAVHDTRSFDLYLVSLRRPQRTHRYARQEVTVPGNLPNPADLAAPAASVQARPAADDVMFPVPWRVQVFVPATLAVRGAETGIATEFTVNTSDARVGAIVVEMFQRGTLFIDEVSGQIFRVAKQRVSEGSGEIEAIITLDRELTIQDLDIDPNYQPCGGACVDDQLDPEEQVRTVWVYPPPISADRAPDGSPIFIGPQPVVGIDVTALNVSP